MQAYDFVKLSLGVVSYLAYVSLLVVCFSNASDWMPQPRRRGLTWRTVWTLREAFGSASPVVLLLKKCLWLLLLPVTIGVLALSAPVTFPSLEAGCLERLHGHSRHYGLAVGALVAVSIMTLLNGIDYLARAATGVPIPGAPLAVEAVIGIGGLCMCVYHGFGAVRLNGQRTGVDTRPAD